MKVDDSHFQKSKPSIVTNVVHTEASAGFEETKREVNSKIHFDKQEDFTPIELKAFK